MSIFLVNIEQLSSLFLKSHKEFFSFFLWNSSLLFLLLFLKQFSFLINIQFLFSGMFLIQIKIRKFSHFIRISKILINQFLFTQMFIFYYSLLTNSLACQTLIFYNKIDIRVDFELNSLHINILLNFTLWVLSLNFWKFLNNLKILFAIISWLPNNKPSSASASVKTFEAKASYVSKSVKC